MKKDSSIKDGRLIRLWRFFVAGRRKWLSLAVLIIIGGFIFWRATSSSSGKVSYQTSTVQKGTVVATVSASGKVLTTNTLVINTQAAGVVKKVYVKDGDKVYAGQTLATITLDSDGTLANAKAYASYLSAQNNVYSADNSYRSSQASLAVVYDQIKGHDTDETLVQKETRTKAEVANDNAYNQTKLAQANLVSAEDTYRLTSPTITAPFSGIIESVNLVEGMVLSSSTSTTSVNSQRVAVIKGDSLPVVNVAVSEVDVPKVKVGQKATITFDSIPNKTFTGVVATVDRVGTVSSNVTSYSVNVKLDSGDDMILPNMAATADIMVNTATDVLFVPSTSLITQNGNTYAKLLVNGKELDVEVGTGISSDTDTVITSGLSEGQTVITATLTTSSSSSKSTGTSVFSSFRGVGGGR